MRGYTMRTAFSAVLAAVLVSTFAVSIAANPQAKGRYKKSGTTCAWDANDSGPNQCEPQTPGRFKHGANNACVWDATESGPDQCKPPAGRWKKDGSSCVWDAKDSGPNQCNPRQVKH